MLRVVEFCGGGRLSLGWWTGVPLVRSGVSCWATGPTARLKDVGTSVVLVSVAATSSAWPGKLPTAGSGGHVPPLFPFSCSFAKVSLSFSTLSNLARRSFSITVHRLSHVAHPHPVQHRMSAVEVTKGLVASIGK